MAPQKNQTCRCCKKVLSTPQKLRQHYNSNKNPCTLDQVPIQVPITDTTPDTNNQVPHQPSINEPVPEIDTEVGPGPNTQAHRNGNNQVPIHDQAVFDYFKALGLIEEPEIEETWHELGGDLLSDKAKSKQFKSVY